MNENLDLVEILKYCPIGTKLYSSLIGECELRSVNEKGDYPIQVLACNTTYYCYFTKNGIYDKGYPTAECLLFPSKDNRDWSTFKVPNKLPKTWEEFCALNNDTTNDYYIDYTCSLIVANGVFNNNRFVRDVNKDKCLLPNKETAQAMLTLCQLIQLRDWYNNGWKPDWKDACQDKYCIHYFHNDIVRDICYEKHHVLSFKTPELRDEFLKNFRELIEIAKPLL